MKLKDGFVLHDVGGEHMVVATGEAAKSFQGLIRNNDTANAIFKALMTDTTEEKIVDALEAEFDAPRETIARGVAKTIGQLQEAGFLDE